MQRYFVRIVDNFAILSEDDVFHLTRVMRAKRGTEIEAVCDGSVYLARVEKLKPLQIPIIRKIRENNELSNNVILIAALVKGEKMDMVLQKATELGVSEIILLQTERTIVKIKKDDKQVKFERFRKILKEAAEQSKRTKIPSLYRLITLEDLDTIEAKVRMIAYEQLEGSCASFNKVLDTIKPKDTIAVLIGPEGGFSESEVEIAMHFGYKPISLGRRILRAETASFYALSVIANHLEK